MANTRLNFIVFRDNNGRMIFNFKGMLMKKYIDSVPLDKVSRLLNHGPTVLVSSRYSGVDNVMSVAWSCMLDFSPPKITVVLGREAKTREFIEKSGYFVVQIPTVSQLQLVYEVGHRSLSDDPEKLTHCGVTLFSMEGFDLPFVSGCSAWLVCRLLPEKRNQDVYDLFMAEVIYACADSRVFKNGRWIFEKTDASWRSLHYISGGRFYAIGEALDVIESNE